MLSAEQDGASGERAAAPARLRKRWWGVSWTLQPPLELGPAALVVALGQVDHGPAVVRLGEIGFAVQGVLVAPQGLGRVALQGECRGSVVVLRRAVQRAA